MFELPVEIVGLIALVVAFLVAQGVKGLLALFKIDVSGYAAAFTAVAVGAVVFFAEGIVGLFPADVQQIIVSILQALSLILGMFGAHKTYKGLAPAPEE